MHVHILGICGTFMAGVAELAVQLGHRVTGSDANVYPPMSSFLHARGIAIHEGYGRDQFEPRPDLVVIGNALSRGNEAVEFVLNEHLPYCSGAEWLSDHVLGDRHVLAVAGTHGKTTTTSILAWILQAAGLEPGFLIGGIAHDFDRPATLGGGRYFVIEADEYDTAFFDKRSKFVHYRPDTLIINNLEFDHADIFPDLAAIETQFHHLMRTLPSRGLVLYPAGDPAIENVLARGCWSRRISFGFTRDADRSLSAAAGRNRFELEAEPGATVAVQSPLLGRHNQLNAAAAILAACEIGVDPAVAAAALAQFGGVKRRLEIIGRPHEIVVYDDFAHHPTAIAATLGALRDSVGDARILCLLEPRSNTMRLGVHAQTLGDALGDADAVFVYTGPDLQWDPGEALVNLGSRVTVESEIDALVETVSKRAAPGDHIVIMSNGGFAGIHARLLDTLQRRET